MLIISSICSAEILLLTKTRSCFSVSPFLWHFLSVPAALAPDVSLSEALQYPAYGGKISGKTNGTGYLFFLFSLYIPLGQAAPHPHSGLILLSGIPYQKWFLEFLLLFLFLQVVFLGVSFCCPQDFSCCVSASSNWTGSFLLSSSSFSILPPLSLHGLSGFAGLLLFCPFLKAVPEVFP